MDQNLPPFISLFFKYLTGKRWNMKPEKYEQTQQKLFQSFLMKQKHATSWVARLNKMLRKDEQTEQNKSMILLSRKKKKMNN